MTRLNQISGSMVVVGVLFCASVAAANPGQGGPGGCSAALMKRSAAEVLASQRAALAAGDWETVRCNYAADAVVISDMGVTEGVDDIVMALQGFGMLFGGTVPVLDEEIVVSILNDKAEMARILFSITTPCVDIPDGTDTYIVRKGKIVAQTAHGFPVFKCFPPPGPPPGP
jgi:hypothetical protein